MSWFQNSRIIQMHTLDYLSRTQKHTPAIRCTQWRFHRHKISQIFVWSNMTSEMESMSFLYQSYHVTSCMTHYTSSHVVAIAKHAGFVFLYSNWLGVLFFVFTAMFMTVKSVTSSCWHFLVCSFSLTIVGLPLEATHVLCLKFEIW